MGCGFGVSGWTGAASCGQGGSPDLLFLCFAAFQHSGFQNNASTTSVCLFNTGFGKLWPIFVLHGSLEPFL